MKYKFHFMIKDDSPKGSRFTLVELAVAIAVFSLIVIAGFQFISATQNTWNTSEARRETFENARIALDLISRDLESIYYGDGTAPFWFWRPDQSRSDIGIYRNELLAFISDTPMPPNDLCTSTLCEVKYQLFYASDRNTHADSEGWVMRSVTGNKNDDGTDNLRWNYLNNLRVGFNNSTDAIITANRYTKAAFTANDISSDPYRRIIPYVLDLSFYCDSNGVEIQPDTITRETTSDSLRRYNKTTIPFPSEIIIYITLMDRASWNKWISLQGTSVFPSNETTPAQEFREKHQITFTRSVYIGDRGGQQ